MNDIVYKLLNFYRKMRRLQQTVVARKLIEGTNNNSNNHSSIIHFSFNKAATQYVKSILVKCTTEIGMFHAGINEYAFNTNFPYLDHLSADEMEKYQYIFKRTGYLYSVFGGMVENIPALEDYKIVLVVRDPRDMLVSNYYSMAFSHPAPDRHSNKFNYFMEKRERAKTTSIDQFVLNESHYYKRYFDRFNDLLLQQYKHVYITKYEDMVVDFKSWFAGLLIYCDLKISESLKSNIIQENMKLIPVSENVNKHIRKGKPGDYVNKLQSDTIQQLNRTFSNFMKVFGYAE